MNRLDDSPLFIALFIFTLISYLFSTLAFIVSQWYSMYPGSMSDFQNIGLWEVCFNSFMNEDIYDKLYSDCFYISSSDISDLYKWIVTNWFLACQIIYTLSYVSLMLAALICTMMSLGLMNIRHQKNVIILISLHCLSWVTCFVTLILFGVNTKNLTEYQWMPKPTQCSLSWSYGSASLSLLATMISLGLLFFVLKSKRNSYVYWSCSKNRMDQRNLASQIEMGSVHTMAGPSIYDPRGTSSASKISAERDRSLISSRLGPSHHNTSKVSKTVPQTSSVISDKPSSSLYSKKSKQLAHSDASLTSEKSIPRTEKPVKISSPAASQLTVTSRNPPPSSSIVIAAKPMRRN